MAIDVLDGAIGLCQSKAASWAFRYNERIENSFEMSRDTDTVINYFD